MSRAKADFTHSVVKILNEFYDREAIDVVPSVQQGYSSTTFLVSFADSTSVVLQFRPKNRPLVEENFLTARSRLGDLVPSMKFLKEVDGSIHVYELTRIDGCSFSVFVKSPDYVAFLPSIAGGMGRMLGMCYVPGSRAGDENEWSDLVQHHLQAAIESVDPLVLPNRSLYTSLLSDLRSGILDELPLAITNEDISPTNLMVSARGVVTGLVDWEDVGKYPVGFEAKALFWLMGVGMDDGYVQHHNAGQAANCFWVAFFSQLPEGVRKQWKAVEFAMNIGAALATTINGECNFGHFASLQDMLSYRIPLFTETGASEQHNI
ncbi:hypothetical protein BD410DRAFT_795087 [Rickenella mellea]|uniref:Aminoglycoside phosphotransferase domain-containing protein n=1 Tax=Rickenella mellea TaxID=50990 RepID=A0A4Y7PQA1_9AGAM|nr:hypothetical protein BD410DRAFT_795087 [Rickenella mellea]